MANPIDCVFELLRPENLKSIFGDNPPPQEAIRLMAKDLQALKESAANDPSLGSYNSRLTAYVKDVELQRQIDNGLKASELRKARNVHATMMQKNNYENPFAAFKAELSGPTTKLAVGARDSSFGHVNGLHNEITSKIFHALDDAGIGELAKSGLIDGEARAVARALALGDQMPKVSEAGQKLGQIMHDTAKFMLLEKRNADIPVRSLPGYSGAMLDDFKKLHETNFETWSQSLREGGFDKEKTFGVHAGNAKSEEKILRAIYDGKKMGFGSADSIVPRIDEEVREGVSYSKKLSARRILRFADAGQEQKYQENFGKGTALQSMLSSVGRETRMIGLVRKWGPNPEAGLSNAIDTMIDRYKSDGRMDLANKLTQGRREIEDIMHVATNKSSIPGMNTKATIADALLTMNALSKLVYSGLMSLPNLAVNASILRSYTGSGFMENMARIGKDWVAGLPMENRIKFARQAGFAINDANTSSLQSGGTIFGSVGKGFSYLSQNLMKFNGMDFVNSMQFHFARYFMSDVAEASVKPWGTIDPQMKTGFLMAGITEKDFPFLRHAIEDMPDGRQMVTVEGLNNLSKEMVAPRAAEVGLSASAYISDLKSKYHGTIIHGMTDSTTSSTWRERAITSRGHDKGSYPRMLFELVGQFKQFLFQAGNITAKIANSAADPDALAKGELTNSAHYNYGEMAKFLAGTTAMAGMSLVLKEELKRLGNATFDASNQSFHKAMGWNPPEPVVSPGKHNIDPRTPDFWVEAMGRGGAGGLFADALLGDNDVFPFAESLLGPTFGTPLDAILKNTTLGRKMAITAATGHEIQKTTKNAFIDTGARLIKSMVPFGQAPLMEQALNYGYYNVLKEGMNPGYVLRRYRRQEQQNKREGL